MRVLFHDAGGVSVNYMCMERERLVGGRFGDERPGTAAVGLGQNTLYAGGDHDGGGVPAMHPPMGRRAVGRRSVGGELGDGERRSVGGGGVGRRLWGGNFNTAGTNSSHQVAEVSCRPPAYLTTKYNKRTHDRNEPVLSGANALPANILLLSSPNLSLPIKTNGRRCHQCSEREREF